jgi:hypothetical protein
VKWVTSVVTFNSREDTFMAYGNETYLDCIYRDVCPVVRIGMVGKRLGYPKAAQVEKAKAERANEIWSR